MQLAPLFGLFLWFFSTSVQPGEISGTVVDAKGGEILASVEILIGGRSLRAVTDSSGHFRITGLEAGDYELAVATVGYHLAKRPVHLEPGEKREIEIVLSPDTFKQTVAVEAKSDPFEPTHPDSPGVLVLSGNDMKNLASVMADDPLRAVQSLPGVSSNNDFDARFSLRGASFSRIGLYLDGVQLHEPFHMIQGQGLTGTGSAFSGDLIDTMELQEGAYPSRFSDRSAGVIDITTREGSRSTNSFRASASASDAGVQAEGPLGKHGSWLASTRKSYLQYVLARTFPDATLIFGIEDAQARLSYDITGKHNVSLYALESFSSLDRAKVGPNLGVNSVMGAGYHYTFSNLGWRFSPSSRFVVTNHFAWMREKYDDRNPNQLPMSGGFYGEWVWNSNVTWMWSARSPLEAGTSIRRMRDEGFSNEFLSVATAPRLLDRFNGTAMLAGGYLQQSWQGFSGRLRVTAGGRWDRHSLDQKTAVAPAASVSLGVTRSTNVQLAWGQYAQFPEVSILTSVLGSRALPPLRSTTATLAVEQRIGQRTRVRAEFYDRRDCDVPFQPLYDPRVLPGGSVFNPPLNPLYTTSLRGNSRGAEVFLQHTSANRLTGWVSYAYGRTPMRDGVTGRSFPSDLEQRHTVNVYGGYRVRPSVNLSARWTYGSGFPIPGFLEKTGGLYYLTSARNQLRFSPYSRADVRVNKAWTHEHWKLTLYAEAVNVTNRSNYTFESYDGYNSVTRQAWLTLDKMFPVLPSAGWVFER